MGLIKLKSTDAFVVRDFDDGSSAGIVRQARKILQSSATDLARSATYAFASHEMERGGASGGINAEGDQVAGAIEAAVAELEPLVASGDLHLHPGKGVTEPDLEPLQAAAELHPLAGSDRAVVATVVAATRWALGGSLEAKSVAIEQGSGAPPPQGLSAALSEAGAIIVDVAGVEDKPWLIWGAEVDAILAGSKLGTLTHQGAGSVRAAALVPWGPIPFTTKALAMLLSQARETSASGTVGRTAPIVVPDFLSASGGLIAGYAEGNDEQVLAGLAQSVDSILGEVGDHRDGPLLGACHRAEAFMARWRSTLPFGRPLAA